MRPVRLLLISSAIAVLFGVLPATASAQECWKELVNDYWADNRVDHTYPIECYRKAMESFPPDVQQYSDAEDDLRRALLAAIRDQRDSGGGFSAGALGDERSVAPPDAPDDEASKGGFLNEVLSKLGPKNADAIPVPLLILGAIALLLIGAAGVSYVSRLLQQRRLQPAPKRP